MPSPFLSKQNSVLTVDAVAKRYGVLPSALLDLTPIEFTLCARTAKAGILAEQRAMKAAQSR